MTNYSHGHEAEKIAAAHLETLGYTVLAMNWRNKRAEIDIIAQKRPRFRTKGPVIFFEVKYRETDFQGRGLDYITLKKLHQMQFAADIWVAEQHYTGEHTLGAIELSGMDYEITAFLDNIC